MRNNLLNFDVGCFSANYQSAREAFLSTLQHAGKSHLLHMETFTHPLTGPNGESLTCEFAILGDLQLATQVLVLQSSTHGVEGFAGSAIQIDCISPFYQMVQENQSLAIVLIYAINPWGFAWLRRTDHEGIDTNRNFVDFTSPPSQKPEQKRLLQHMLALKKSDFSNLSQLWDDCGLDVFVNQISYGQYEYPSLICYGGKAPGWSRQTLEKITNHSIFTNAQQIVVIDLHTGLGPYGYGEIINDHIPDTPGFRWAEKLFGANAKSALLGESSSAEKSGLIDYHWHKIIGDRGCFVTLEFGTYNLQALFKNLFDEQAYQNTMTQQSISRDLSAPEVKALKAFFYPAEPSWQEQVLFRGRQAAAMALQGMGL